MNTHEGKVAIVTGGGSGLGESICKLLADRGATVVVTDISMESAERVAGEITDAGGKASAFRQDTARAEDSKKAVEYAMSEYGALHYAVNNAGIGGGLAPAGETDLDDWNRVIDINLNGVLYGMRYQIPAMLETDPKASAIVNIASIHGAVAAANDQAMREHESRGAFDIVRQNVVAAIEHRHPLTERLQVETSAGTGTVLERFGGAGCFHDVHEIIQ